LAVLEPSMIGEPADPFATPLEILPECLARVSPAGGSAALPFPSGLWFIPHGDRSLARVLEPALFGFLYSTCLMAPLHMDSTRTSDALLCTYPKAVIAF
ncbi:unnamed protein product, partial [Ilex paraguariensis]